MVISNSANALKMYVITIFIIFAKNINHEKAIIIPHRCGAHIEQLLQQDRKNKRNSHE